LSWVSCYYYCQNKVIHQVKAISTAENLYKFYLLDKEDSTIHPRVYNRYKPISENRSINRKLSITVNGYRLYRSIDRNRYSHISILIWLSISIDSNQLSLWTLEVKNVHRCYLIDWKIDNYQLLTKYKGIDFYWLSILIG